MYGMGLPMYLAMLGFQLPLCQVIGILPKINHEATTMDKAYYNIIGLGNKQKGDLR
jgi:hypothetical protein